MDYAAGCAAAQKSLYWGVMKPASHIYAPLSLAARLLSGLLLRVRAR